MGALDLQISDSVEAGISKEFKLVVKEALREADERALDTLSLLIKEEGHPKFARHGACKGCFCHLDERTPGCNNCKARHNGRRRSKLIREQVVQRKEVAAQGLVQDVPVLWGWL